jgi:hypothetical protein
MFLSLYFQAFCAVFVNLALGECCACYGCDYADLYKYNDGADLKEI